MIPRRVLALVVASVLGLFWNLLVVRLMGGVTREALAPAWLLAGIVAGLVAGVFTLHTRERRGGDERALDVAATYYLAMLTYWSAFVVVARVLMVWRAGGWTDFDLGDHLRMIVTFASLGTLPYGLVLVPLTWASRALVWRVGRSA